MKTRISAFVWIWLTTLSWFAATCGAASAASTKDAIPQPPPLPPIDSLTLEPASLILHDGRDEQSVLVWGTTASGERIDLTSYANFQCASPAVVFSDGYIRPREAGETEIIVKAEGKEAKLPVKILKAEKPPVRFVRDIMPVISKVGCNAGTCHGSAKGKNGFKLSLRGYDPEFDYHALINDLSGRRFNRVVVEESLMLLKPTGEVPHEGRQVIKPNSPDYQLLREWISEGTKFEDPAVGRATKLEVLPAEINLSLPGMTQHTIVLAHYPDGTTRDVTHYAVLSSSNPEVALVKDGVATAIRRGEAAMLIRYEGLYATQELRIMGDRSGFAWQDSPEYNFIDKQVNAKLRKMKILPSEVCTDAEFIRRVSLDLTGQPPKPDRVRAFLNDTAPTKEKRERLVDELIGNKDFIDSWANKWADLLQCNSESLGQKGTWVYREWINDQIAKNKPYDQFVRDILLAEGSSYLSPAVNYYRVLRDPGKITEDVCQTFLGTRFNCNKCHDHPFERWTQSQYYQLGAYFAQVAIKRGTRGKETIRNATGDQTTVTGEEIVYRNYNGGDVIYPKTGAAVQPKVPFGHAKEITGDADRRDSVVAWLTSKENPLFAKSAANRIWSYFFGRGIIEPVDDIRGSNPPSNAPLLDALTADFIQNGFDLRKLMRTICTSRTYQLSFRPNRWNEDDRINFSHAQPRRLSAEQMLDAIDIATGYKPKFGAMPAGTRAVELPDGMVANDDFLALFGRPKRQSACECERTSSLTLSHAMSLINGATISEAVNAPGNRIQRIVDSEKDNAKVIEDLYVSCLDRLPSEKEISQVDFAHGESRLEVAQDLAWALLNSPAFLFNR